MEDAIKVAIQEPGERRVTIAEANTARDIDNRHTETQLEPYFKSHDAVSREAAKAARP
jgi:hypothetical protein